MWLRVDTLARVRYSRSPEGARGAALIELVSLLTRFGRGLFAAPNGSPALIRRLLVEHGSSHWRRYLLSFALMAGGAACTATMAFIICPRIDQAYTERSFEGVALLGVTLIALFSIKGLSTYRQAPT